MDNYNNDIATTTDDKLLTTLFKNPKNAEKAYDFLISEGYDKNDITVIMSDETRNKNFIGADIPHESLASKAVEGMGVGGAIGGTIGAIAAAVAAIGTTLAVPGLGLVIAGPIAAAFAGAGAGSAVGGMIGALAGAGIPAEQAKLYEDEIKTGGILIGVKASNQKYNNLENELNRMNSFI